MVFKFGFCVCLFAFVAFSSFIQVDACSVDGSSSLLSSIPPQRTYLRGFIYAARDGYLGCFRFLAVGATSSTNILREPLLYVCHVVLLA